MLTAALDGRPVAGQTLVQRRNGECLDVEVHAVPMQYRNEPHVLAVLRDLTSAATLSAACSAGWSDTNVKVAPPV